MKIACITGGIVIGAVLLWIIGVYLFDAIAGYLDRKHPSKLSPDERRAADYAAYKAKQG